MTLLAFAIIYFVWGSTFLAIRVGVREVPPFLFAAMRFLIAGTVHYGWTLVRRERAPTARQWLSAFTLATLIFVGDYGLLFWAERRVPSGPAAVMMATIPVFTAVSEILILRTRQLTFRLGAALLVGILGVAVLTSNSLNFGGAPVDPAGATALICASMSWSLASALMRKLPLPASKAVNSASQMLAGGLLLLLTSAVLREPAGFRFSSVSREAWLSLLYLSIAGSVIAFTAYVWLNQRESPTKVGTYAYVNPVVAVFLGYFFGGEMLGLRTVLGTLCVLISVVVITATGARKPIALAAKQASISGRKL